MRSKHAKYNTRNPISGFLVRNFRRDIAKIISNLEFNSILDIGCGEGFLLSSMAPYIKGKRCCAIDIDENEVRDASHNLPFCELKQGSAYEIPYENGSFELVMCTEVLEHLEKPDLALKEIFRVSSKFVLLSVPDEPLWRILNLARLAYPDSWGNTPGHINHWSSAGFCRFTGSEFQLIKVIKPLPWIVILAGK